MRGFTLIEVLVAVLIGLGLAELLFRLMDQSQLTASSQLEAADVQQRLRVGTDAMLRDLRMAGAGRTDGPAMGPLSRSTAPVLPYRRGAVGDDPAANVFYRPDAVTVLYVASTSDQSVVTSQTYYVRPAGAGGLQLMHYNGAGGDFPVIDNVVRLSFDYFGDPRPPRSLSPPEAGDDPEPLDEYPAGENCLFVRQDGAAVPRLPPLALDAGLRPLDRSMLTDGPWCPNSTAAGRFDADLLRIRRIRVRLRVQASFADNRGPAGPLFSSAGTAGHALRLVPDLDLQFDVTPRNLNAGW